MSNSIWKTPDQKPDTDQHVLFFAGGGIFPYLGFYYPKFDTFNDWESKDVQRWASVFEVIAQADKAERLQKAVDFLSGHLRDVLQLDEYGHIKLDEITKQQIKTATSDPVGIITQLEQESNN